MKNICLMLLPLFLMSCLNKDNNIVSLLKEWGCVKTKAHPLLFLI